jgi:ferric-dicitrate binding protein FerR (iron transport regulator)
MGQQLKYSKPPPHGVIRGTRLTELFILTDTLSFADMLRRVYDMRTVIQGNWRGARSMCIRV